MTEQFVVGLVGAPFGLKGFVKVRPLSGEIDHLKQLKQVLLRQEKAEKVYEVEEVFSSSHVLTMKFQGIDTPEAARALKGAELVTDRSHAAPLKAGEFYVEDLRGLEVTTLSGEILGHITDIIEGGGGDLAEVGLTTGESRLVPFRNEFFGDIDPENRRAVLLVRWILE
ncbi:MAG: ribosome maturation factor RimM [Treponema sp.]|jgi:16S rRNA processing protein RimM|nr:ribosome maturation factor RimM [Treponema sp.]